MNYFRRSKALRDPPQSPFTRGKKKIQFIFPPLQATLYTQVSLSTFEGLDPP